MIEEKIERLADCVVKAAVAGQCHPYTILGSLKILLGKGETDEQKAIFSAVEEKLKAKSAELPWSF